MPPSGKAKRTRAGQEVGAGKRKNPSANPVTHAAFKSDEEVLEAAHGMIRSIDDYYHLSRRPHPQHEEFSKELEAIARDLARTWHKRLSLTPESVYIAGLCRRLRLNRLEREILVALLLEDLGLSPSHFGNASETMQIMAYRESVPMAAQRAISEGGKLYRKGILYYDDPDEDLRARKLLVDPGVLQSTLMSRGIPTPFSVLKREEDLHEALAVVTGAMKHKSDELRNVMQGHSQADFQKYQRKLTFLLRQLDDVLKERSEWKLSQLRSKWRLSEQDWVVVLALFGKALLHAEPDSSLFTGAGLSRAVSDNQKQFKNRLGRLTSHAPLVRGGYIQPCGGGGSLISESPESIQDTEYELTEKSLDLLGWGMATGARAKRDKALREPSMSLNDLALSETSLSSIRLALDHVQHADKLMNKWGLRSAFPYGTGVTMLFHGPPGTGKTATAEAIAHELGMLLLVADYAKIQNCWLGQTEKNISATFRKARQHRAVLFWDEADAMFFDRDSASQSWEVRHVNVLLQEIERFEGVCILATNRKATFDKALERRITTKIEFPRPDRTLREAIWKRMLPKSLPLAKDVDIAELAQKDMSGGEIKNVILNAARAACGRKGKAPVTMDDFRRALDQELKGSWATPARKPAGFLVEH
jgi:AAA+ superfamily predicted ATPase